MSNNPLSSRSDVLGVLFLGLWTREKSSNPLALLLVFCLSKHQASSGAQLYLCWLSRHPTLPEKWRGAGSWQRTAARVGETSSYGRPEPAPGLRCL